MQWALSEKMFEELLLTDEWSRMSDADMDTFLDTPGIETVEAIVTEKYSNVNGQNDLVQAQDTSPVVEDIMEIVGINEEVKPGGLEGDSFDFFENVESNNAFYTLILRLNHYVTIIKSLILPKENDFFSSTTATFFYH